jgi:hypothetical protein
MYKEMKLRGIEVSLDTDTEGSGDNSPDRISGCWLNIGKYSGSLALALDLGGLEDVDGNFLPINPSTLTAIEGWAELNGY